MSMEGVPDRPYASLTAVQLETRIAGNLSQQQALEKLRTQAAKYQLTQLKRTMADLVAERNSRADMQTLPF